MTDTPMTQDKHDTLIERLEDKFSNYCPACNEAGLRHCSDPKNCAETEPFDPLIKEAISHLKQSQWTPIEDIPEEWKDGYTKLDLLIQMSDHQEVRLRLPNCIFSGGKWMRPTKYFVLYSGDWFPIEISDEHGITSVTHAMLPPQPPKL